MKVNKFYQTKEINPKNFKICTLIKEKGKKIDI